MLRAKTGFGRLKTGLRACVASLALLAGTKASQAADEPLKISGRYPHLAMFNKQGECGTGAVMPWAERLWVITYAPHKLEGSDDKLYEIDADLKQTIRPESVGGTPANRMIHKESNQLSIGPYLIDDKRNVRVLSPKTMPGRLTATLRHMTDPANQLYIYTMEGRMYEVNVKTLESKILFDRAVPGWHGKGAYLSQGRLVVANNGESHVGGTKSKYVVGADATDKTPEDAGVLAEFDGTNWKIIERRQFTDVTSAGGIEGAPAADAPLWAIGWDKRSLMLKLLDKGTWQTFRLPKMDNSYDGKHGWHTEWPRIRETAPGKLLMNLHGGWFDFPKTFSAANTAGLRPIASYLKVTGDVCYWKDQIVFGCDDLALSDFGSGNTLKAGNQSISNLWFSKWDELPLNGRPSGFGGVWLHDAVKAGEASAPYLIAGFADRTAHLYHAGAETVAFTLEIDADGTGKWAAYQTINVPANGYAHHVLPATVKGEWIRVKTDKDIADASAFFTFGPGGGAETKDLFAALPDVANKGAAFNGTIRARGGDLGTLMFKQVGADGAAKWYEVGLDMAFKPLAEPDAKATEEGDGKNKITVTVDVASAIVSQGEKRFRIPKTDGYDPQEPAAARIREVVTERSLLNAFGSFYVLPRNNSGGVERIKPVCTHNKRIADFCSWRGLMVLSGAKSDAKADGHFYAAADGSAGLWFGDIDDLWRAGKPRGKGGPWLKTTVKAGEASDGYLMANYDKKTIELSHDSAGTVTFTVEVDPSADGSWQKYQSFDVPTGRATSHEFPAGYSAHWVRVKSSIPCNATAQLTYE